MNRALPCNSPQLFTVGGHFGIRCMGYPSYARNSACALPSLSPFHYVMAKIVPMAQLGAHAWSWYEAILLRDTDPCHLYFSSPNFMSPLFPLDDLGLHCSSGKSWMSLHFQRGDLVPSFHWRNLLKTFRWSSGNWSIHNCAILPRISSDNLYHTTNLSSSNWSWDGEGVKMGGEGDYLTT